MFYESGVGHRLTSQRARHCFNVSPIVVSLIYLEEARDWRPRFFVHVVDIRRVRRKLLLPRILIPSLTFHHDGQTDYLFSRHVPDWVAAERVVDSWLIRSLNS